MDDQAVKQVDRDGPRVVVVDSRPERRQMVRHLVESAGGAPDVREASSPAEAVDLIDRDGRDVAVVEIQMPVDQGMETITALRGWSSGLRIVVCSFRHDEAIKEQALARGADAYLDKPVSSLTFKTLLAQFSEEPPRQD